MRFRLGYSGPAKSGKLSVHLAGAGPFAITSDGCTGKRIGKKLSCLVSVSYTPHAAGAGDSATLWASNGHGPAPNLDLHGSCSDSSAANHVYWVTFPGTVNKVASGGGCVTTLATGQRYPVSVAVDNTNVYWVDLTGGTVKSVPLDGGSVTTLASGQTYPTSVAADGTHVYWVNFGYPYNGTSVDGTLNEVPVGGGAVTTLAGGNPSSVAVDGTHVYWTDAGDGTVNEVPVGGGSVTTLASGQSGPFSVAVDGTHVYWVDSGTGNDMTVDEVPLGGGSVTTLASGQIGLESMAVGSTHAYWIDDVTHVKQVPLGGGGSVTTLADSGGAGWVAADGTHVYWANGYYPGTVNEVPVGGGSATILTFSQEAPTAIAVGP
jgi:hypothetical protein